jgi:hypothetical protein
MTGNRRRITVSRGAERALTSIVDRVNEGFAGGRVNRTQVANWVLSRFSEQLDDAAIKEIRMEHFDEVAVLESILRQAKESGRVPTEFKCLLQKQLGMDEAPKKTSRKALTKSFINDENKESGELAA